MIAVAREEAENVLTHLRSHALGCEAAIIGEVVARPGVRSVGLYGVKRTLDLPHAEPLREFVNDGVGARIAAGALYGYKTPRTCSPAKRSVSREKPA